MSTDIIKQAMKEFMAEVGLNKRDVTVILEDLVDLAKQKPINLLKGFEIVYRKELCKHMRCEKDKFIYWESLGLLTNLCPVANGQAYYSIAEVLRFLTEGEDN